jgi:acetyl esterase/lipase
LFTCICFMIPALLLSGTPWAYAAAGPAQDDEIVVLRDLAYQEGDSPHWTLDLAMKREPSPNPRPCIVVIHGGGWIEGDKSSFSQRQSDVPGNILHFAELGFVAVTINYRLASAARFPAALDDCKTAVRWLRANAKRYNLDPDRIGAYGNSAGGHLALLLGMPGKDDPLPADALYPEQSSHVQAVVSDSGPIDLIAQHKSGALREVCTQLMGGPPQGERLTAYQKASPSNRISGKLPPLLLIYGVDDGQVPVETADRFVLALGQAGVKDVSYYRVAATDHCPYSLIRVPTLRPLVDEFFKRTLVHSRPR